MAGWPIGKPMPDASASVLCDMCGVSLEAATVAATRGPLAGISSYQTFYCQLCDHYTFANWRGHHPPAPDDDLSSEK